MPTRSFFKTMSSYDVLTFLDKEEEACVALEIFKYKSRVMRKE
jgi:hypothetical protein